MFNSVSDQTLIFLQACLLGSVLGLIYDCLRVLRRCAKRKQPTTSICDASFVVLSLIFILAFLLFYAQGSIRGFLAGGMALGIIFYFFGLSSAVLKILTWIYKTAKRCTAFTLRTFIKLFNMPRGS